MRSCANSFVINMSLVWGGRYLTEAPYLVVLMKESYKIGEEGERIEHYYPEQSVGIAAGMFLCAVTAVGLVTLPSTPMGAESFIRKLLGRRENEKVYLLLPGEHGRL